MKNKITIDDQINHMKSKGVKFNVMSEDEAKDFLLYKTYYFKLLFCKWVVSDKLLQAVL